MGGAVPLAWILERKSWEAAVFIDLCFLAMDVMGLAASSSLCLDSPAMMGCSLEL